MPVDTQLEEFQLLNLGPEEIQNRSDEISAAFEQATSEQELLQLISTIDELNGQANSEMNHYIRQNHRSYQQDLSSIELNRAKLSDTLTTTSQLIKVFSDSNDIGSGLTVKLKALDKEIGRIQETTEYVTATKLLKNNINQAVYALEHNNYELAANCLYTIRSQVPDLLIDGEYASSVIPSTDIPELPRVTIDKLIKQLIEIFKTQFDQAASKKDIPRLTKFFQLFPLIGQEEAGLNCYSQFICQIITDTLRSLIQSISAGADRKTGLYSRGSMQLFENISIMLSQHSPLIKKFYSSTYPQAIPYVIKKIQHEIDSQIGLITDTFYDETRMGKIVQDIKLYNFPVLRARLEQDSQRASSEFSRSSFEDNELVTLVEAGDLFSEFASIFNYWSLYCKFISSRYFVTQSEAKLEIPQLLVDSSFTKKIHTKYFPVFESIFNFYFRRSLEKAITIEELPELEPYLSVNSIAKYPEHAPCSSVIEDFTLVLNTCLKGVIDSSQIEAVKLFVLEAIKVIKRDLIFGYFVKELNENLPRYNSSLSLINPKIASTVNSPRSSRAATPSVDQTTGMGFFKGAQNALGNVVGSSATNNVSSALNNPKLAHFILYLNTVATGQDYVTRILTSFTKNDAHYIRNSFPFGDDVTIVQNILKLEFLEPFITMTNKVIQDSLINFYNMSVKARLLSIVSEFLPDTDEANYHVYSSSALNDTSSLLTFISGWRALVTPYRQVFHHELVYIKLLRLIILNLANMMEKRLVHILRKFKINELGALKLEKDISGFIAEVCEDNYEMREKFVRVTQLILLVGMSDDEYEDSVSQDGGEGDDYLSINWVLTPAERKQFRGLRM